MLESLPGDARVRLGPFTVDPAACVVTCDGEPCPLGPRAVRLLAAFAVRPGEVIAKSALMELVWAQAEVEEGNLTQQIYLLRKLFRDRNAPLRLQTVARRGYRLVVESAAPAEFRARRFPWRASVAVGALMVAVGFGMIVHARSARAVAPASDRALRMGSYYRSQGGLANLRTALAYFFDAIIDDPGNAAAFVAYSETSTSLFAQEPPGPRSAADADAAMSSARRAVALAPQSSSAHRALAAAAFNVEHDDPLASNELHRALQLNPRDSGALVQNALVQMQHLQFRDAETSLRQALAYDPQRNGAVTLLGWDLYLMRRYADAAAFARQGLQTHHHDVNDETLLAFSDAKRVRYPQAIAIAERLQHRFPASGLVDAISANVYAAAGNSAAAREEVQRLRRAPAIDSIDPFGVATIASAYALVGRTHAAQAWLSRVDASMRREVSADPLVDAMRRQPWFVRWSGALSGPK